MTRVYGGMSGAIGAISVCDIRVWIRTIRRDRLGCAASPGNASHRTRMYMRSVVSGHAIFQVEGVEPNGGRAVVRYTDV
jgi:hypothetical protein